MALLERNLEALGVWTPTTAALIAAAAIPSRYAQTPGTDGTLTYRRDIDTAPRRIEWLGGTSMPIASAASLIESLAVGTGNGLGLSIGTGYEWLAFAQKLSNAQAVFVYELDPAQLRMALDICDLTSFLQTGKIILFTGPPEAASNDVSAFLARHVGYEPPSVLHPLPTLGGERRNPALIAGEAIVRRVITERQALLNALAMRVEESVSNLADARIALTVTPRYAGERPIRHELANLPELRIDHHARTSLASRLQILADHRPREIISDLFRHQLSCIPAVIAVETWIPPTVGPAYWDRLPPASTFAPTDRVIVHHGSHESRLIDCGVPKKQIHLRAIRSQKLPPPQDNALVLRHRVALIADLSSTDAASLGIQLPTHLAVFAAAHDLIIDEYLTVHINAAADILRRALHRANVASNADGAADPALREPMLRVIRDVLIPTLPILTLAESLVQQNISLRLIGDWTGFKHAASDEIAFTPFPAWQEDVAPDTTYWQDAAALLHLSPTGTVFPLLLNAVAAGVAIVAPQHATDSASGSLPSLLKPNAEYAHPSPQQLTITVKSLLRDAGRRSKLAAAAMSRAATFT